MRKQIVNSITEKRCSPYEEFSCKASPNGLDRCCFRRIDGGVINIIRKHPEKKQVGVSADWTSRQKDGGVSVDFGKTGKWAWRTSFKVSDIRERGAETASNQYGRKYYFNLDGRMDIAQRKHLDFFFDYMNEDLDQKSEAVTQTGGNYRSNPGTVDYNHKRYSTGLRYAGEDRRGAYEMQVYYTLFDKKQETHLRSNGILSDFDDMVFRSYIADGKRNWNVGADHKLTFGGEYRKEEYESTRIDVGGGHIVTRTVFRKLSRRQTLITPRCICRMNGARTSAFTSCRPCVGITIINSAIR